MKGLSLDLDPLALVLFALLYFLDGSGLIAAAVPAVLIHEAGHLLPLWLCGHRPRCFRLSLAGLELDYAGRLEGWRALLCVGGGPLLGLSYALAACTLGGGFWSLSGALSFLLSAFNLLPVLPLDGGRLVAALTDDATARGLSRISAILLMLGGGALALTQRALGLLGMGLWLTVCNFRRDRPL